MFQNLTLDPGAPLPSLNALRAFEAMARTGSATRAAEELNVTHSAVSRQVKALESQLGLRLFEGPRHALTLTATGRELAPALTGAFDDIAAAVAKARGKGHDLHLAIHASLAVKWLIPRLSELGRAHPQLKVHLADLVGHATTHRGADLILRLLTARELETLDAYPIVPNAVGPVIAPQLLNGDELPDLSRLPLLLTRTNLTAWQDWSALSGVALPFETTWSRPMAHLHFVLDAAISGLGIAVMPWAIASSAVLGGQLVAPFGFCSDGGAVAVLPGAGELTKPRRDFLKWLQSQGQQMPAAPAPVNRAP